MIARLILASILCGLLVLSGCASPPSYSYRTQEPRPVPRLDRDALLSLAASCHLLRVGQTAETAVTDATVVAAVNNFGFSVEDLLQRSDSLLRAYRARERELAAAVGGSCDRLAAVTGAKPALVRFDQAGAIEATWLRVKGEINEGFAEDVIAEIRRRRASGLIIESSGGSVYEARQLGRFLRANGIRTAVDKLCLSACVDVLAGGVTRLVTPGARLGIHQSRVPKNISSHEGGQTYVAEAALYLREMGVDSAVALVAAAVPHDQIYLISTENALETRLATQVVGAL
jgi:hypothetical protein